jgi:glycosyltransferase involved in cell wall biosynthesis
LCEEEREYPQPLWTLGSTRDRDISLFTLVPRVSGGMETYVRALAVGCPVAISRVASLPEVCGDIVRYFEPREPEQIAAAVAEALEHPDESRQKGIEWARSFSWERCAREHEIVYRELIS